MSLIHLMYSEEAVNALIECGYVPSIYDEVTLGDYIVIGTHQKWFARIVYTPKEETVITIEDIPVLNVIQDQDAIYAYVRERSKERARYISS